MKKTISQKLSERNYKTPSRTMQFVNYTLTYFMGKKYHCEYNVIDDINKEKGPAIVLFNHLSRFDHIFITQILYPRRYNIVAARNEFYRGQYYTLFKLDKCIPKRNFTKDITAMKAIRKVLNEGGTVVMAPEGMTPMDGKNHPIGLGAGHLLKYYKVPVYQIELRGQFMIASKVCLDERLGGKCSATLRKLYTTEDLERLSEEEIESNLNEIMKHDEFEWQKEHHYKYDLKGESMKHMEDLCYECPKCHEKFHMVSKGNDLYCEKCGNGVSMDDYYDFIPFEGSIIPETPSKWCDMERINVIKEIRANKDYSFSLKVKLGKLPEYKPIKDGSTSILCGEGIVTIDHSGFHYKGTKDNQEFNFDIDYNNVQTVLSALDFSYFDLYYKGDWYDFFPEEKGRVGYIQLLLEEMHRLHVNSLKNFPWNEYMYK